MYIWLWKWCIFQSDIFFITWYQFWQRIYACIGDKIYPQFIVYIFSLNLFLFKFFFILRLYFPPRELPDIKAGAKNPFSAGVTMKWIYLTWWNPGLNIYSQNINKNKIEKNTMVATELFPGWKNFSIFATLVN